MGSETLKWRCICSACAVKTAQPFPWLVPTLHFTGPCLQAIWEAPCCAHPLAIHKKHCFKSMLFGFLYNNLSCLQYLHLHKKPQPPVGHYSVRKCTEGSGKRAQPPKPSQAAQGAGLMSCQPGVQWSTLPLPSSAPPPVMSWSFILCFWLFCL